MNDYEGVVIVNHGLANYPLDDLNSPAAHLHGTYLAAYDPDADDGSGSVGVAEWTAFLDAAMVFPSLREAHATWTLTSTRIPTRPDGQPNRPLTMWHIEVVTLAAARTAEEDRRA
jgi:hypothetical protein